MPARLLLSILLLPLLSISQSVGTITTTLVSEKEYNLCKAAQPTFNTHSLLQDTLDIGTEKLFFIGKYDELTLSLYRSDKDSTLYLFNDSGQAETPLNYPVFSVDKTIFGSFGWLFGQPTIQLYKIDKDRMERTLAHHLKQMPIEIGCVTEKSVIVKFSNKEYYRISLSHQER